MDLGFLDTLGTSCVWRGLLSKPTPLIESLITLSNSDQTLPSLREKRLGLVGKA